MEKREIKFRGKRTDNGELVCGNLINWHPHLNPRIIWREEIGESAQELCFNETNFEVSKDSVSQYTGLKDKNGKEIYEDDILNHWMYKKRVVIWNNFTCKFQLQSLLHSDIVPSEDIYHSECMYYEIIGNIYENN